MMKIKTTRRVQRVRKAVTKEHHLEARMQLQMKIMEGKTKKRKITKPQKAKRTLRWQ